MRLIGTLFIICLFGKLINCNNNNDQAKVASTDNVANNQSPVTAHQQIESRSHPSYGNQYADASSPNLNIYTTNLSPKESAHSNNPNAPVGYIQIQPMLAPFGTHQPDSSPTTSFIRFIKPEKEMTSSYHVGRRSFGFNRLKNFMSSLFWKDSSSSTPYMTSGSSYSFALKQPPPFSIQNQVNQSPASNYANLAQASLYKPVVFGNYAQSAQSNNNNFNKYTSSFNPQYVNSGSSGFSGSSPYYSTNNNNGPQSNYGLNHLSMNQPYLSSGSYSTNLNNNPNSNALYLPQQGNTGFPSNSYQVAAASNMNSVYSSSNNNQYSANGSPINGQADSNAYFNNQRASIPNESLSSSSTNLKQQQAPNYQADSSSSSSITGTNSLPLNSNASSNPVSLINSSKQQFASSY